jgi:hypothetical protein
MQRGDLVKLKERLRDSQVFMYTDAQMKRMEALIYIEHYTLNIVEDNQACMSSEDSAVVLEMRDIHKDGNGVDIVWNRFVKIVASNGMLGWVPRSYLTKV